MSVLCMCIEEKHVCHDVSIEVRIQLEGVISWCEFQGWHSDHQCFVVSTIPLIVRKDMY